MIEKKKEEEEEKKKKKDDESAGERQQKGSERIHRIFIVRYRREEQLRLLTVETVWFEA